jgi:hypothetical protein
MRMPEMTGAQFLEKARELSPDSARVLLTAQVDVAPSDAPAAQVLRAVFEFATCEEQGGRVPYDLSPRTPRPSLRALRGRHDAHSL